MGRLRPRRFATATSPQVIWKQPSPIRHTTGSLGCASLAAIAAGRPKPIDDQPLVMRKVFGACAVHWLAIWCVCAPTSKVSTPSRGSARRTASIAACALNELVSGRSACVEHAAMIGERLRRPAVGCRRQRGEQRERAIEVAADVMHEVDRRRDVRRLDVDLQQRNVVDPGFVFDLDGVVAKPHDQVGGAQELALDLPARAFDAADRQRGALRRSGPWPWSWSRTASRGARPPCAAVTDRRRAWRTIR